MKRCVFVLIITILLVGLCSCKETEKPITPSTAEVTTVYEPSKQIAMEETPRSTCFSSVGYSADKEILLVTFRDSGKTYQYSGISESLFDEFINAESMGQFYNSSIKGKYHSEKLG